MCYRTYKQKANTVTITPLPIPSPPNYYHPVSSTTTLAKNLCLHPSSPHQPCLIASCSLSAQVNSSAQSLPLRGPFSSILAPISFCFYFSFLSNPWFLGYNFHTVSLPPPSLSPPTPIPLWYTHTSQFLILNHCQSSQYELVDCKDNFFSR